MQDLSNFVIITGCTRGIGYKLTEKILLHPNKFQAMMTFRDEKRGHEAYQSLVESFPDAKDRLHCHQLDIGKQESINQFVNFIEKSSPRIRILINNAAIGDRGDYRNDPNYIRTPQYIRNMLQINVLGTISLTEMILPFLTENGRIINLGSTLGQLRYQGPEVQKKLNSIEMRDREKLFEYIYFYKEKALKGEHTKFGFSPAILQTSKAFLMAWSRWVLPSMLKPTQACVSVHPGWVATDMGGKEAPMSLDEGTFSTMFCVDMNDQEILDVNGKYINEKGIVADF